jgi:hypothetical protein
MAGAVVTGMLPATAAATAMVDHQVASVGLTRGDGQLNLCS